MWLAGCVINTGGFVRIKVRLPPDALQQMWCFTRSLQQQQQDLGTKAPPDSSMLDKVFMFSQLTLKDWGQPWMAPVSWGADGEVQLLFEGLECGWVTEISSSLSGIWSSLAKSEAALEVKVMTPIVCLLNCLAPLIVYCLIFLEMWIWRGYMYVKVMFKKLKGMYSSLRNLVFPVCFYAHCKVIQMWVDFFGLEWKYIINK